MGRDMKSFMLSVSTDRMDTDTHTHTHLAASAIRVEQATFVNRKPLGRLGFRREFCPMPAVSSGQANPRSQALFHLNYAINMGNCKRSMRSVIKQHQTRFCWWPQLRPAHTPKTTNNTNLQHFCLFLTSPCLNVDGVCVRALRNTVIFMHDGCIFACTNFHSSVKERKFYVCKQHRDHSGKREQPV